MVKTRIIAALLVAALVVVSAAVLITASPARTGPISMQDKYIMAFHSCDNSKYDCSNWVNHVTYLAESNDGASWSVVQGFAPYNGSVPDAIRRGNTVYLYNPGTLVKFFLNNGTETRAVHVHMTFANGTITTFVDPSVYLDSSGTLHLFFPLGYFPWQNGNPANCPTGVSSCTVYIYSATEVPGSDGSSFVVDPGYRVGHAVSNGGSFSDPSVFKGPGGYYLYVSVGASVLAYESPTLNGDYTPVQGLQDAVLVPQGIGGTPAGFYDNATQSFWTYVSQNGNGQKVARAVTSGLGGPIPASQFTVVLSGCAIQGMGCAYMVESPAVHLNTP